MRKIKFEMDGNYCKTTCPHGMGFKVNSFTCRTLCPGFIEVDSIKKILICKLTNKKR